MKNNGLLMRASLAIACLLSVSVWPAAAYIDIPPPTLGSMCSQSSYIFVLRVERCSAEKGVILFKPVEQLKGKAVPDGLSADVFIEQTLADMDGYVASLPVSQGLAPQAHSEVIGIPVTSGG